MELAIFSERPAFEKPLYVGSPVIEEDVKEKYFQYMSEVFNRNWFTNNGPMVQRLEAEIAKLHGAKYCVAVCNATIAEILVLKALELSKEIILPSFTFIATAHACLWQGAKTVFCDISPDRLGLDPAKAEELINNETCAVIGVHLFGNLCDIEGLTRLSKKHNIKLIFDAAHAFNCYHGDKPIGCFGDAVILSFHATKFFGTFEGGAILTNDPKLAERLRFLRNFGFRGYDNVGFLGINGKMSESSAAMGLASIPAIGHRSAMLKNNLEVYRKGLSGIPGVDVLQVGKGGRSNYQYMVMFVDEIKFGVSRDVLCKVLWKENIIARKYFYPGCHNMEPYRTICPDADKRLGVTDQVSNKVLCLPLNLERPEKNINIIVSIIKAVNENPKEASEWARLHL
ncbi:MAG: aminotransferase class I/II-fold pyridoxal phosphate-dependent enzyme [Candidatus Omnitrophica bacterium]|nr:aminotransferase class I/II-fold pyridoxal phosphate-dependent enzyme [Candidatus Omnitrophota bacterium]